MTSIRALGVIAEYGSLAAYRTYLIEGRHQTACRLHQFTPMAEDETRSYRADLQMQIMDWDADIAWVDAEIAAVAVAA